MAAPPSALHPVETVEASLEALSDVDEAGAAGKSGSSVGVQPERTVVQCRGLPHEPGLAQTLL